MEINHNIYILDHPMFSVNNINFLSYIKKNQSIIKDMGVKINITSLSPEQLDDPAIEEFLKSKKIEVFPVLITDNKIYKGLHDIVNIYETNINEYHQHIRDLDMQQQKQQEIQRQQEIQKQLELRKQQEFQRQQMALKQKEVQRQREAPIDDDEQMHSYISQQLQTKSKMDDDEEAPFGDSGNNSMMDTYRHMMTRRNGDKRNPFNSKMRTVEDKETRVEERPVEAMSMQDVIYKQLQNGMNPMAPPKENMNDMQRSNMAPQNRNNNQLQNQDPRRRQMQMMKNNMDDVDEEREDNIKGEVEEEVVNIDPSKIEYDVDDDPGDAILEKAYWSRNAETK